MFVKHGDGKIVSVVDTEELTEEQKKVAKNIAVKQSKKTDETDNQDAGSN
jgi:hypothetical protein